MHRQAVEQREEVDDAGLEVDIGEVALLAREGEQVQRVGAPAHVRLLLPPGVLRVVHGHAPEVQPQAPVGGRSRVVGEEAVDHDLQPVQAPVGGERLVDDGLVEDRHLALEQFAQDLRDPGEVIGQCADRHAAGAGDVAHGRGEETAFGDDLARRIEEQHAADLGRLSLPFGGRPRVHPASELI